MVVHCAEIGLLVEFDRLVVMDADLSHPPERIADLPANLYVYRMHSGTHEIGSSRQ